ncbi:MAG: gliding motility protein GldL [Bacteroidaceae bacterium]|nr:gliding motility protein GldL [Bacteroidaceae bacterium]
MEREKKSIINRLQDFLETRKGQTILNYLYSWGAAVVILGALFKLTHIKGADLMLFIGMGTEVLVFFISGFDRQASTLGGGAGEEESAASGPIVIGGGAPLAAGAAIAASAAGSDVSAPIDIPVIKRDGQPVDAEALAAMANLAAANAAAAAANAANGPIVIGGGNVAGGAASAELPEGFVPAAGAEGPTVVGEAPTIIGHGGTVDIPEMEKVTTEYVERLRELSESFSHVAEQAEHLENCSDEMERLSRNLTSINTIYELHLKSLGGQINNIDSVNAQTQRMADQIEELNAVYKRMLESMTVNMGVRGTNPDANPNS